MSDILAIMGDPEARSILDSVLEGPKPATSIEHETGMSQTGLYRKILHLRESGLLMVDSFDLKPDGKKEALYACTFDEICIKVEEKKIQLELIEAARSVERRWFELFFSRRVVSPPEPPSRPF